MSHTIMFSPDAGRPLAFEDGKLKPNTVRAGSQWVDPANEWWTHDVCNGTTSITNCNNADENYAFHPGGGNFSFGDGSVHFLTDNIDLDLAISLITRAGDDQANGDF